MKLLEKWDTVQSTLQAFNLPPSVEKALRWVERHPQAVVAAAAVLVMAVVLAQAPPDTAAEQDAYSDEIPLFV